MNLIRVKCSFCEKEFLKARGHFNEAKKFGWNQYCSKVCQNKSQLKGIEEKCANPACHKIVYRPQGELKKSKSGRIFCSSSCAAIMNNQMRQREKKTKKKTKICKTPGCFNKIPSENQYCSKKCWASNYKKTESEKQRIILNKIKTFYNTQGRIPTKKEKPGLSRGAQAVFGTWNKAIKVAGFQPNPVLFAKKYIANDGHKCDSLSEKIIDDWLTVRKIKHQRNISYPENKSLTVDFVTKKYWIEFFGLAGEIKNYDRLLKKKQTLAKKYKLPLIEIYPKDLFPTNCLSEIIEI